MELPTRSLAELNEAANRLIAELSPHPKTATLITLSGELGAGKTTFVQAMARTLGVEETVTSPTFVLEKIYKLEGRQFSHLVHIDAYRLKGAHELEALGWKELLADSGNLIVLEWPERVAEVIPHDATRITFDIVDDGRIITVDGQEKNGKNIV